LRWVADITEVKCVDGELYLAGILDLHDRGIAVSSMSGRGFLLERPGDCVCVPKRAVLAVLRRCTLLIVLSGLVVSACSFRELSAVNQRLGAGPNGDSIDIWYVPCRGESVNELTFWELDDDKRAMNEGDVVLWTARAGQLSSLGSSALVPMDASGPIALAKDGRYLVDVQTSQGAGGTNLLVLDDLGPGLVRVDFRNVTMEEFRANALKSCAS
jgi:hypothetical protein